MCMADYCDEYVTELSNRRHTARKEHKCVECYRIIQIGETYNLQFCVLSGNMEIYKTCAHCQVVKAWLEKECGGYLFLSVYDDILEHAREGYGLRVKMLAIGMQRKWKRKDGRMWPVPKLPPLTVSNGSKYRGNL